LRVLFLEVEPAQDAALGARVVVLHERAGDARLGVAPGVVALQEEPARVAEDAGLDEEHARQRGLGDGHRASTACRSTRSRRYVPWALLASGRAGASTCAASM